jgi:5-formyltetrahydrofolate cyclo-ligase
MSLSLSKKDLRQSFLKQRRSLSQEMWREKSDRLSFNLTQNPLFIQAKTVLAYFSFNREPDLSYLFTLEKNWGFPRCQGKSLIWHYWQIGDPLEIGSYGIKEPSSTLPLVNPNEVDLILVPAVASDRQGYRLGYGGGFYDRMLDSSEWKNIPTIGIVFDFAVVEALPIEPWDCRLDSICVD